MKIKNTKFYRSLVWLYRSTYSIWDIYRMPQGFCEFFWKMMFAILLLPLNWWAHIINYFNDKKCPDAIKWNGALAIQAILLAFGMVVDAIPDDKLDFGYFKYLGNGILVVIIVVIGCVLAYLGQKLFSYIKSLFRKNVSSVQPVKEKKELWISVAFKSFMEKNCPKIDWSEYLNNK